MSNRQVRISWETGSLWPRLKSQTNHGLETGALQSIETDAEYIEENGIRFLVRILANLSRKEKAKSQQGQTIQGKTKPANPFLPYEPDLYVTDISETHLCLLNKFNVVDHHFLIVTREFESQENWLTLADFEALVRSFSEVDGLGFFNGGAIAGASQPHKHLQVIPLFSGVSALPITAAITTATREDSGVHNSPSLPFKHAIAKFKESPVYESQLDAEKPDTHHKELFSALAKQYLTSYHTLLTAMGVTSNTSTDIQWQGKQTAAYNLLCTRQWMMLVPRSQEKYADISVNSLGFAGSLLVRNQEKLEELKAIGPMTLLKKVACLVNPRGK
ncbi:MAG: DUF4922 domain-containing protein [Cyanobacteria bacterium P01_F01_bin.53]